MNLEGAVVSRRPPARQPGMEYERFALENGRKVMGRRILFLSHAGVLGGAELSLLDIVKEHRDEGHVLLFSDGPFRNLLEQSGVQVAICGAGSAVLGARKEERAPGAAAVAGTLNLARKVAAIARDYDLLYASSQKAFVVACLAGRWAHRPVLWHLHDIMSAEHFSALNLRVAIAMANRYANRVITNSATALEAFVTQGGRRDKVRIVHYGIDPAPFDAVTEEATARMRKALGLGEELVVGVFSRLAPWKGQHVLIEALPRLPGVQALLVGDALFGEQVYLDELRRRVNELGLGDRVHFLGFRSDIPLLMHAVDVVLHTSIAAEPFGRVIVEGMLSEKPVVATRAGGPLEIVQDGITGYLVRLGDVDHLARTLRELLKQPQRMREMGRAGRKRAQATFNIEGMSAAISRQIDEALAG
jgi:glycosyltransferase involved in cell wall biosynthesis